MHRLRSAAWAVWLCIVRNRFSIRNGNLYVLEADIKKSTMKNGVRKIYL